MQRSRPLASRLLAPASQKFFRHPSQLQLLVSRLPQRFFGDLHHPLVVVLRPSVVSCPLLSSSMAPFLRSFSACSPPNAWSLPELRPASPTPGCALCAMLPTSVLLLLPVQLPLRRRSSSPASGSPYQFAAWRRDSNFLFSSVYSTSGSFPRRWTIHSHLASHSHTRSHIHRCTMVTSQNCNWSNAQRMKETREREANNEPTKNALSFFLYFFTFLLLFFFTFIFYVYSKPFSHFFHFFHFLLFSVLCSTKVRYVRGKTLTPSSTQCA